MKKSKIIEGYDLSGVTTLHGLSLQQYYDLLKHQGFKCPVSKFDFIYDKDKKKFIDSRGEVKQFPKRNAPPIDHCHDTGHIRGILTQTINWLENQWVHNSYGSITKPPELTYYQNNPPAYECIGKVNYK